MLLENTAASWRSNKCHCPPSMAKNRPQLFGRWWSAARLSDRRLCSCDWVGSPWVTRIRLGAHPPLLIWVFLVEHPFCCLRAVCGCLSQVFTFRENKGKNVSYWGLQVFFLREVASQGKCCCFKVILNVSYSFVFFLNVLYVDSQNPWMYEVRLLLVS